MRCCCLCDLRNSLEDKSLGEMLRVLHRRRKDPLVPKKCLLLTSKPGVTTLSAGPAKTSRTVAKTFAWAASKSRLESRLRWKIQRYYHLLKQWEINLWMFLPSQRTCKRQKLAWESCVKTCHRSNLLSPLWRKSCQWKLFLLLSKELTDRPCPAMFGTHHWQSW